MTPLRRCLAAKLPALSFAVLIALPFTAPFQVWNPDVPISKSSCEDFKSSDKISNDTAIAAQTVPLEPLASSVVVSRQPIADRHGRPGSLRTVLRV